MSPIRPEMRRHYPHDWPVISKRIRKERALDRCECDGRCGRTIPEHVIEDRLPVVLARAGFGIERCVARQGEPSAISGKAVVLTVAHLNHDPSDCRDENLMAACQSCHLAYDAEHHAQTRAARLAARTGADSAPTTLIDL